jgi:hypothetical protein
LSRRYVARLTEPEGLVSDKNRRNEGSFESFGNYSSSGCLQDAEVSGQRPDVQGNVTGKLPVVRKKVKFQYDK